MSTHSSSPVLESSNSDAGWKRKYEALEAEHKSAFGTGKVKSLEETQIALGRSVKRVVDMFRAPREMVEENDRRSELYVSGTTDDSSDDENAVWKSYEVLTKHVPLIQDLVEEGHTHSVLLEALYVNGQLRKGSDNARGDDACKLKSILVIWINEQYGPSEPPLRCDSKVERGLGNNHTGRLLCPAEHDWDNMEIRTNIRDGHVEFPVTAASWPAFCYPNDKHYSAADIEKGLFRGKVLVKDFKYIFLSPSSVLDDASNELSDGPPPPKRIKSSRHSSRANVASRIGLREVTPRSIAYIAVQVRFALSNGGSWHSTDGEFDHVEFYNEIVNYFEVTPGLRAKARVDDLLQWWNTQVFGARFSKDCQGPRAGASVSKLAAQRKAREEVVDIEG